MPASCGDEKWLRFVLNNSSASTMVQADQRSLVKGREGLENFCLIMRLNAVHAQAQSQKM